MSIPKEAKITLAVLGMIVLGGLLELFLLPLIAHVFHAWCKYLGE